PVFKNPLLSSQQIDKIRGDFYDDFLSFRYYIQKSRRQDFYSQIMARTARNHLLWRMKVPKLLSVTRRITGNKKVRAGNVKDN
ncbi:MAG: hypothetical protein GX638_05340, partial [Crenarchaeota archaeon]|nr:hypothetical protein [Thermoproteota archaeon]